MNIVQQLQVQRHALSLLFRGRPARTDTGVFLTVIVEDLQPFQEPETVARKELPIATRLTAPVGSVPDPRAIKIITELEGGREHVVLKFSESVAESATWRWECEATRQLFPSA